MSTGNTLDAEKAAEEIQRRMILEQLHRSDDFRFELQVKSVLEGANAQVTHGWTYIDPIEDKPRQFDLRAHLQNFGTERHHLRLAVECKNLDPVAPLLISGISRTRDEAFYDFVQSDGTEGLRRHVMRVRADCELYSRDKFVGKSLLRLKPDDKVKSSSRLIPAADKESDVFGRWSQALASADDLCQQAALVGAHSGRIHSTLILPAVVVPDGALWTVEYDKLGAIVGGPMIAKSATFFVNHEITIELNNLWTNLSHVHFFTLAGLREFLQPLNRLPPTDWFPNTAEPHKPRVH